MVAASPTSVAACARGPSAWIWGARTDLAVFGGSAAIALALVGLGPWLAPDGSLPTWGFIAFVIVVDVAHVWTTLFRTYLDREELAARKPLYIGLPIACYAIGAALHLVSERIFWRTLAYLAVIHFVRQQIGWVAIYRARAGERSRLDRWLDDAVIYAATGWPLLVWHARLPRAFRWLVEGDFVPLPWLEACIAPALAVYVVLLTAYAARAVHRAARGDRVNKGKHLVVATTALTWFVGIVATDNDFAFTVTNILVHGVPYMALLWAYARARGEEAPRALVGRLVAGGFAVFLGVALVAAFAEEMLWDRLVWHDCPFLFGRAGPVFSATTRALLVPLLAVPQATHYVLDALLWRRKDTGAAQARALGFGAAP